MPRIKDKLNHRFKFNRNGWKIYVKRAVFECTKIPCPPRGTRYLGIALAITIAFFIVELVGGILTNSLALLTDAWHMLNHIFALVFALTAVWLALRPVSVKSLIE